MGTDKNTTSDVSIERLFDAMDTLIVVTDIENDRILLVNERMRKEFGFDSGITSCRCWEVLTKGFTSRCEFCPKNTLPPSSDESVVWEFNSPIVGKRFRIVSRYIDWHDNKRVFLEQCYDITELRDAVDSARDAEERIQLVLDSTPLSCILWDSAHTISTCNREALKFFGVNTIDELNQNIWNLSPQIQPCGEYSDDLCHNWLKKAFENGYCRFEWHYRKMNGDPLPCEVILVRLKYRDEHIIAEYTRDLREQKAHESEMEKARSAAEAANKAKSVFLANMSHEIRTPMNSIIGFCELALNGNISPETKGYLQKIADSAEWLLFIINDILDISKIEAGRMNIENVPFDMRSVFSHCRAAIMPKAQEKGLAFICYAEPSVGRKILGDPIRLRQALLNVLTNAVKFTNNGTVKLSSSIIATDENSVTMRFEVKDSGIGMTPEQVRKVFAPFEQADTTTTRQYGGTGLGLTITRNIVELMGGTLTVDSAPGVGSRFSFDLKFDTVADDGESAASEKTKIRPPVEKPNFDGKVLVCEDNPLNQQVVDEHLRRVGINAVIAENGKIAVDIIEEQMRKLSTDKPFDLILMDVHMPVMDGIAASRKIIELGAKTPIVAMTANIMIEELETYKQNGMDDYLGKPFTSQDLWRCLAKYLTVVSLSRTERDKHESEEEKMLRSLRAIFVKSNKNAIENFRAALESRDMVLAHRIAHTLKSTAAQIGEQPLSVAAADAEAALKNGEMPAALARTLETEMTAVLERLKSAAGAETGYEDNSALSPDSAEAKEMFEKLAPMLASRNPQCMTFADKVRRLPGGDKLADLIEDFEFKLAEDEIGRFLK